jgi:hypothetical protein
MSWDEQANCLTIEPWHFDDVGTPWAWNACAQCPVIAECDQAARQEGTHGVYRAGKVWPDIGGRDRRRQTELASARARQWVRIRALREQGKSLPAIGRAVGMHHTSVLNALRRMGVA